MDSVNVNKNGIDINDLRIVKYYKLVSSIIGEMFSVIVLFLS